MEIIKAQVDWCGKNFSGGWGCEGIGAVIVASRTFSAFKSEFESALRFHIEGMDEDGAIIPAWLSGGDYILEYELTAAALLRRAEEFTTLAAISRASGINQKQLSHYANGTKKPRPAQRARIVEGLRAIGQACMEMR